MGNRSTAQCQWYVTNQLTLMIVQACHNLVKVDTGTEHRLPQIADTVQLFENFKR